MRFYGIDRERIGSAVSVFTAAACIATLPRESALAARLHPEQTLEYSDHLLRLIASAVVGVEIPYPWERTRRGSGNLPEFEASTVDEFDEWYNNTQFVRSEEWQVTL